MSNRSSQPIELKYGSITYALQGMDQGIIPQLNVVVEQFRSTVIETDPLTPAELAGVFLGFVASFVEPHQDCELKDVLRYLFQDFNTSFLKGQGLETLVRSLLRATGREGDREANVNARLSITKNYYIALVNADSTIEKEMLSPDKSNILVFGGIGGTENFSHLLKYNLLFGVFFHSDLLVPLAAKLAELIQSNPLIASAYPQGFDLLNWLEDSDLAPVDYMLTAPVAFPIRALSEFVDYIVKCKESGMTPGEYLKQFSGALGRGTSIVTAVAATLSDSWDSFFDNAVKAVSMMVFIGSRAHLSYNKVVHVFEENELKETPTPMLLLGNIDMETVNYFISTINSQSGKDIFTISIFESTTSVVIAGTPSDLYQYTLILRGTREVLPDVWHKFLPIHVPLHSELVSDSYEQIMQDINNAGINFSSKDIKIPVLDTNVGANLQGYDSMPQEYSLTSRLVKLIIELPEHFDLGLKFVLSHPNWAIFAIGPLDEFQSSDLNINW